MINKNLDGKYHWNEEMCEWQRTDRIQRYKGIEIATITTHADGIYKDRHRAYIVIWNDGRETYHTINKRGDNITSLKRWIDYKLA